MESLALSVPSSPLLRRCRKTHRPKPAISKATHFLRRSLHSSQYSPELYLPPSQKHLPLFINFHINSLKFHTSVALLGLSSPLSGLASEVTVTPELASEKISLESVLISIKNFTDRYPFFISGVVFIWLVVIPLIKVYRRKFNYVSAINAFEKLRSGPNVQLLDIRDKKSSMYLCSPNLRIYNKATVRVHFSEADEEGFLERVLRNFPDPENTTLCVLDNFDGNSFKVAELLAMNGFKSAYAIKGGVRGEKGWQEIQDTLLPPSMHVYRKKKGKKSKKLETNSETDKQVVAADNGALSSASALAGESTNPVEPTS